MAFAIFNHVYYLTAIKVIPAGHDRWFSKPNLKTIFSKNDILLFKIVSVLLQRIKCGEIWTACNHRKKC